MNGSKVLKPYSYLNFVSDSGVDININGCRLINGLHIFSLKKLFSLSDVKIVSETMLKNVSW